MKQNIFDIIIIGGGPGGYAAALYCARAGLSTLVLEKMSPGGQMGTTEQVDNYPGFADGVGGFELSLQMKQGAERFGVKTEFAEATRVDLTGKEKKISTSKGELTGRAVILATGASPRKLGVPGEDAFAGRGVSYCATCDGMFFKDKSVVVVGGGNTAAADMLVLAKLCKKVTLIHRRDSLSASKAYASPLSRLTNAEIIWNTEVSEIRGQDKVTGLKLRDVKNGTEREIPCDGVFVAVGQIPNTSLFSEQINLDERGYVKADETTRTNLPGVYAVGDLRQKPLRQIVTAVADGAVAAVFAEEYLALGGEEK